VQAEKEILEIDQIRIDLNKYMIYEDMYYDFYSEHALKKAMRNNLYKELESKYKIIEDNANQITKDVKVKIELYYEKEKNDLENQYQRHILDVQKIINNIKKRRTDCKTEIARLLNIEQHILNNPTAIDVAKSVRLMVPLITKKLSTLAFEESTVVRVSGGTGFQLNNKRISSTALVRSLGDKLNDSYVNSLDKLDKENYTQRIENWQPISFNNQHYHAFFVSHHHSDESHTKDLELSIQKPLMAKTLDEKRLLKLAAQKPNAEQIEEIRILITGGVHLDKTDAYGNTAQHLAAMNDNVGLLKVLLIYCKGTITQNRFGNYPVHIAAMYGHDAALEVLLKNDNENARAITMNDESALYLTVLHHNLSTTKLLIDYGSDINETGINGLPLIYTSLFNGSEKITDYLLEIPDIILNFQLEDGNTLLHAAVKLNQVDLVRKLVKKNLNLNVTNKNGQSPFHIAVELGYFDIIKLLLNFNRSILEEVDSSGYPPLYLAIKHGHPPVCNYLLTMGATYSKLVNKGNALTLALQFRQVNCARKILEHCNYHIDIDDGVDLDNFHTICKLGLWELARVIVETNPKALLKEFKVIKEHELIEPTCYIEYLCKANAYSQFNSLMRLPATALRASGYVKENLRKIYQISIASASEEILRCLVKYNMTNPLANSDKIFGPQEAQSWLYREYDLIQYAFRKNIGLFHSNYLKNKDVDIERTTTDNKNLVYLAAESGNKNLLKILIDRNAQLYAPNGRHIFYALVTNNRSTIIRELVLRYDIDINIIIDKNNGMRAIDLACKLGNIDTILDLIACGGQIDEPNTVNKLAIHYAIQSNALHVTRLIFKYELGGLEPMLRFAILHHKNAVFDQIISNQDNYVSQILACSNELLVVAIEAGNLYVVKLLLGMGAKPDNSLLHLAVKYNQNLTLRLLLATEIDVNSVDSDSNTALHLACKNGNDLIILELIKHKQLNKKLYNNQRKLANELASEWIRNVVLNNNLDVIGKNLVKIIQDGSLSKFKSLISSYKIPINSKVSYTHNGNSAYFSLLEVAIFENNNIVIEYLLEQSGANPTEINSSGLTAVHLLMKLSDAQFVVSMIEKFNLDIHISNSVNGITPLHFAVLANNPALINYLITHGADIYAEESNSETIIELAIEHNSPELVKLLIEEHNYDLHHKSNILESPLAIALKTGNLAIAQYLVSKGADIFSIDGFNCRSMLHYAVLSENIKVVHYALTLGIDERIQDSKHMLALHLAAKQGNVDIVELLSNSNPLLLRATDMRGRNANDFALIHLKKEVSSYISKRYGNIFKDKPTFENAIRFKKYRHGGRSQLELAIIAEDQTNIERLIITVNPTDSNAIESAICYAAASANPTIFIYILNQLWNQVDHKVIRKSMMSAIVNNRTANLKEILKIIGSEIILEDGCSPIELACKYTTPEVLRCLLDYNHDNFIQPSAENIYLALKSTIDNNSITQAKMLIESCDTCWEGVVDSSGNSLLHHAVAKNRAQMLALFIMCGAEDKRNYAGNTARHLAHKDGKNECLKYLKFGSYDNSVKSRSIKIKNTGLNKYMEENEGTLDYELFQWLCSFQNVNLTNSEGKTPLHVAIKNRDRRAIEILLSSGANTLIEDKNGCSVLKKACDTDLRILKMVFPNLLKNPEGLNIAFEELCSNKEYNGLKELRKILSSQKMLNKKDPTQLFQDIRLGKTSLYTIFLYEEALAGSENILHLALDMNEVSLCEFIIMNSLVLDKNFNVKDSILAHDKYGHTVIHRAITLNHPDFLRNILAQLSREEADPEDMDYISPIVFAMCRNRRDCFKLLSDHGAKVEKNFKWSSLYKQLPHLWCGVQEIDADDIQRLIDIESLEGFFEEIMKFSHNSLCEKYSQIIYSMAQRRHPIEGSQYFMMIAGKTNDKDVYEYFELLAKYLPLKLLEIKSSTWYLSDFPTLFTMAYANDNSHLFNYFLESGENPYWVLDSSLVVENGLKVHSIYNLWYGDRLAELSRKLNSDLKFTKMHELARIFISLIGQSKPRINKYHSECWKNIFVLLLRGIDQLGIKPIIFLEYFDKALNSVITVENLSVHSTKEVNFVMEEISKNKLFNDFFLGKQRLSKEKLEDCIIS
jgi:ankyrin repeat protein